MGAEGNGLTLQGLARRLETLERENSELRHEVAVLRRLGTRRDEVGELRGSGMPGAGEQASESEGQVSRRWLLSNAGAAAVAAVAAGTLLNTREVKAHDLDSQIEPDNILTHFISATNHVDASPAVQAEATTTGGWGAVDARNFGSGPGVQGRAGTGVKGIGDHTGVEGFSEGAGSTGVKGTGRYYGIWGESSQAGIFSGVFGRNTNGRGVRGEGVIGIEGNGDNGVYGKSSTAGFGAVVGRNTAQGKGVVGECSNGIGVQGVGKNGVYGKSSEPNYGAVYSQHTAQGTGVWGISAGGYGGQFWGGTAQLKLKPGDSAGAPTGVHAKGEIYMDRAATLWVCVAGGNPATWEKVTTS